MDEGFALHLPDEAIVKAMDLTWTGDAADFFRDTSGEVVTQDPSVAESGPAALLLRSGMVEEMTANKGLSICWIVLGERQAYLPGPMKRLGAVRISGACTIKGGALKGFVKFRKGDHFKEGKVAKPIGEKRWEVSEAVRPFRSVDNIDLSLCLLLPFQDRFVRQCAMIRDRVRIEEGDHTHHYTHHRTHLTNLNYCSDYGLLKMVGPGRGAYQGRERPRPHGLPLTLVAPAPDFLRYQIRTSAGPKQVPIQAQVTS